MTPPLRLVDSLVAPVLLALRDCLCAELAKSLAGPPCRCVIVHSDTFPIMDGCDCTCEPNGQGDAWTRLVRLEPEVSATPVVTSKCPPGWIAVIELGVHRCIPLTEDGSPLPDRQQNDLALMLLADMNATLRALCCPVLADHDIGVDFWQPIGPAGGCAGGALQIRVALPGGPGGC